jgi:hypothetical protein
MQWNLKPPLKGYCVPLSTMIYTVGIFAVVYEAYKHWFAYSIALSRIHLIFAFWSLFPLPFLNPACSSDISLSPFQGMLLDNAGLFSVGFYLHERSMGWVCSWSTAYDHLFSANVKKWATSCLSKSIDIVLLSLLCLLFLLVLLAVHLRWFVHFQLLPAEINKYMLIRGNTETYAEILHCVVTWKYH